MFSQDVYNLEVAENEVKLLADISVEDCDHGVNGRIMLSTSSADFKFKIGNVYREGKPGLQMQRGFDFEIENSTEFRIFATSDNNSINKFNTSAQVNFDCS